MQVKLTYSTKIFNTRIFQFPKNFNRKIFQILVASCVSCTTHVLLLPAYKLVLKRMNEQKKKERRRSTVDKVYSYKHKINKE